METNHGKPNARQGGNAATVAQLPTIPKRGGRLYAITFDMDIESLKLNYGDPYNNASAEIRKVLKKQGFT
jgi:hypothetical protein